MCHNRLNIQVQRFLGRFRRWPSTGKEPEPSHAAPTATVRRMNMELRSMMPSISECELDPTMACDIPNSEINKPDRRQWSTPGLSSSVWSAFVARPLAEAQEETHPKAIGGRLRRFAKEPEIRSCLRRRNELLNLKMRGLDKTPLWLQEPPASKGGVCTKEGGAKPVPKYSFPSFICNSAETKTTELAPKPLTEQMDKPPTAEGGPIFPQAACLSSSNAAMRNREEKLFEISKSHWSQLKEPRPSKQFEDDFDNLRQWRKSQSTSKLQQGYVQKQQQQEQQEQQKQQQQEQDLRKKCEAKRRDHLAAESRATVQRPELLGEVRDAPQEAQDVSWPEKSCQHLKENHMCTVKAKQAVERHQKANENLRESCPIAAEKKAARRQQKHQEDICKDTAKQREQQIFMLEKKCKDILGEQAPQRGLGEELQLREVERLSKCLNLLELKMLLQMKSECKRTQSFRTENRQKQLPQVKKCLEIWEKQELAEKGEEGGFDSDCDGFVLQQIEEISKLCAATKEKYEGRRRRHLESEARKKEEEERIRKEEAEAALRKKTAEALHRISLISDLKQKRQDIATKQQQLQLKYMERSMEEKLNEEKHRKRVERDQTRAEHKQRLRQMKRMVRQGRLSITQDSSTHSLVITPAISKWRHMLAEPRGLEDAFSDPYPERLDDSAKLLGKDDCRTQAHPQRHSPPTPRASAFGSTIISRKRLANLKRYGINDALVVYWLREAAYPLVQPAARCGTKKQSTTLNLGNCPCPCPCPCPKGDKTSNDDASDM